MTADDRTQRGLGDQLGRVEPVLDLEHRCDRILDPEVGHRVDRDRDVVLRDDLLRRHGDRLRLQIDPDDPADERRYDEDARPTRTAAPPEHEQHAPLVLLNDPNARRDQPQQYQNENDREN